MHLDVNPCSCMRDKIITKLRNKIAYVFFSQFYFFIEFELLEKEGTNEGTKDSCLELNRIKILMYKYASLVSNLI